MLIQYYLEQYSMPFLNPTCDMDVNYEGKHKHNSYKILKKNQKQSPKNQREPGEQIYKKSKIFKLKDIITIRNLKFIYDQINNILYTKGF